MMDDIQNPVASANYASLMSFLLKYLQINFIEGNVYTIMSFLSKITFHVDYSHKCSYFLVNYVSVLENCLNKLIPVTDILSSKMSSSEITAECRKSTSNPSLANLATPVLSSITSTNIAIYIKTITFIRGIIALHHQNVCSFIVSIEICLPFFNRPKIYLTPI